MSRTAFTPTVESTQPVARPGFPELSANVLDTVTMSKIVEIRDVLIEKQSRGEKIYRLESGTPAFNVFPEVAEAIIRAVHDNKTFYTEGTGIRPLRERICEKLARKNGITHDLNENTVFVGQGAMGTLYCLLNSIAAPEDVIISPTPVWESVSHIAGMSRARIVEIQLRPEHGFNWDLEEFERVVARTRPRVVIVVNPGNPTGGIFPRADVEPFFDLVRRYGFFVAEDLAYEDIVYDPGYIILTQQAHATGDPEVYRRFIPVFSMSKSQNFSGLRIGYTHIAHPQLAARFRKMLLYSTNGVNSLAQWGAVEALDARHDARLRSQAGEYRVRRDLLCASLEQAGIFHLDGPPKGAFYLFPLIDRERLAINCGRRLGLAASGDTTLGELVADYLLRSGIGSIAGRHFGVCASDYIRFAYTCSLEDCREVGRGIVQLLGPS